MRCIFGFLTLLLHASSTLCHAQQLQGLDPSFGNGGLVMPPYVYPVAEVCRSVAVQPDGKILVSGERGLEGSMDVFVWRLLEDGTFDPTWGTDGRVITDVLGDRDETRTMLLQPDGKVLVSTVSRSSASPSSVGKFAVVRYLPDGSLDHGFGTGGKVVVNQIVPRVPDMALQDDGKIILAGGASIQRLIRLLPNGGLDLDFGTNGMVTTSGQEVGLVAIKANGQIVTVSVEPWSTLLVRQFTPAGIPDSTFGGAGSMLFTTGGQFSTIEPEDVTIDLSGNILVTSDAYYINGRHQVLARILPNGERDSSFAENGMLHHTALPNISYESTTTLILPDERLLLVGTGPGSNWNLRVRLRRHFDDGSTDLGFGTNGLINSMYTAEGGSTPFAAALQPDGRILVAGAYNPASLSDHVMPFIARYHPDGATEAPIEVTHMVTASPCGLCQGSSTLTPSGGGGQYTYTWSPEPGAGQGTATATGLCAGPYTVEVADSYGNTASVTVEVPVNNSMNLQAGIYYATTIAACPGENNGRFDPYVSYISGTPPLVFTTSLGAPLDSLPGNIPFDLTVTDAVGCQATMTTIVPEVEAPSLLAVEPVGPCGFMPTAVRAHFSIPAPQASATGPDGLSVPLTIDGNSVFIQNGVPGIHTIMVPLGPDCPAASYTIEYPSLTTGCTGVSGDIFVETTSDCIMNNNDHGLAHVVLSINSATTTMSNALGHYHLGLPEGSYELDFELPGLQQACDVSAPIDFITSAAAQAIVDVPFAPPSTPEVSLTGMVGQVSPGYVQQIQLTVHNNSPIAASWLAVTMQHDLLLAYPYTAVCLIPSGTTITEPPPYEVASGQLTWRIPGAFPAFSSVTLIGQLQLPPDPSLVGSDLHYTAIASFNGTDAYPTNNTWEHTETVVAAYDPNDKLARTNSGSSSEWSLENDSLITYTVRFQNTGTAPAVTVVVVDTIQPTLDLGTLKIIGASHTFSAALNGRVLSFTFDHIMLPDSNANEPSSHGFVQFSIRPAAMWPGSSVKNFADIHFDFNPPIRTNTSVVTAPLGTVVPDFASMATHVFPNPASTELWINGNGPWAISIWSADGRLHAQHTNVTTTVPISGLAPGVYAIQIRGRGGSVIVQRFVKE